jgi:hypothetical protein
MAGLVPAIHVVTWPVGFRTPSILSQPRALYLETHTTHAGVDGRDKPGHDGTGAFSRSNFVTWAYPSAYGRLPVVLNQQVGMNRLCVAASGRQAKP